MRRPIEQGEQDAINRAVKKYEKTLQILESHLGQNHVLVGGHLSLAEIQFGPVLYRYYDLEFDRHPLANCQAYDTRLTERPAFQEPVMASYAELRA